MSPVKTLLQLCDDRNHRVDGGYRTEDHAGHGFIVPPQIGAHPVMRSQGEAAWNGGGQVKIGSVEEHPRMACYSLGNAG